MRNNSNEHFFLFSENITLLQEKQLNFIDLDTNGELRTAFEVSFQDYITSHYQWTSLPTTIQIFHYLYTGIYGHICISICFYNTNIQKTFQGFRTHDRSIARSELPSLIYADGQRWCRFPFQITAVHVRLNRVWIWLLPFQLAFYVKGNNIEIYGAHVDPNWLNSASKRATDNRVLNWKWWICKSCCTRKI